MTTRIHGFCEAPFQPLFDAFRANFDNGLEVGASLAVTHYGRPVVDLWAGYANADQTRPWERDTIVLVFSTTKIALLLSFLTLVDRGLVDLDATVASYWPGFGAGGKDRVTVREAITHRGGVPGFDPPVHLSDLFDWDATCTQLAAQRHWYGGRPQLCYNAISYGFLLGEIMRRVDGRKPAQFFQEEFAEPVGIDLQMRLRSRKELARIADLIVSNPPGALVSAIEDPLAERAFNSVAVELSDWETWECRIADISAGNGYGNARSIARLCAVGAMDGELDGHRYLSTLILDEATSPQLDDVDPILGPIRMGLGFGLHSEGLPAPSPTTFHWGGYGGSFGVMDRATGISCGYAMNNLIVPDELADEPRMARLWSTLGDIMRELPQSARQPG